MKAKEIAIAFLINLLAGITIWVVTFDWKITVLFFLLVISIVSLLFHFLSFRNVGIISWSSKRGLSSSFRRCLEKDSSSVDFLATWGGQSPV